MRVLQFTIPVPENKSIIVLPESLPYFFPHFHRHKEVQLTWVIKGEGTLVAGNNMHAFQSNDIFFLGANQPHVFKNDSTYFVPGSSKSIQALTIFFNPNGMLSSFFGLPEMKQLRNFIQLSQSGFSIPQPYTNDICTRMQYISELKDGSVERIIYFIDLMKLLSSLPATSALSSGNETKYYSEEDGSRISKIYKYIMDNFNNDISLEDVAGIAYMTTQSFCRYFRKRTGKTFISFLNEVRINEACSKLTSNPNEGISTIAYNCGFNSITNFNRVFRSVKEMTPSEYLMSYNAHMYEA
ncbi:MAG TPA: AraC family transcriptional regulator [Agriterribacter sp.]|nr:AraC family transcriptional regulator [Agriterribacter sp.]